MPTLPPINNAPYDTMQDVLRAARVRLNDAIKDIGGEVLTDDAPFSQPVCNLAWRVLQDELCNMGMARFKRQEIVYNLPVVSVLPPATVPDPSISVWMNWDQFFDGYNYFTAPVLPRGFISPLWVKERVTVISPTTPFQFMNMDRSFDSLPSVPKQYRNWTWSWNDDTLYLPGSTVPTDLLLWFESYLPDFIEIGDVPWYNSKVPIARSLDPFANFICAEMAGSRGDIDAALFRSAGMQGCARLMGREVLQDRSIVKPSELGKMPDVFTPSNTDAPLVKGQ